MKGKIQYTSDKGFTIVYYPENKVTNLERTIQIHPDDYHKAINGNLVVGMEVEFEIEDKYAKLTENDEIFN